MRPLAKHIDDEKANLNGLGSTVCRLVRHLKAFSNKKDW
jgi:hypothetical protein